MDFLRFLWWPEGNFEQELVQYRMTFHLFGALSSPSCACYALRKTANDNSHNFPAEVIDMVKRNFYVDDLLKSLPSEVEAIVMVQNLKAICLSGGFNLTKWLSNSCQVLSIIPEEHRSKNFKELDLDREKLNGLSGYSGVSRPTPSNSSSTSKTNHTQDVDCYL